ncbi:MAG: tetratricopeptide repeat protein [Deltaproteobacteria bacterium]|nr:tetratricopeptide repeat protein [Deltaproteobacteria bacterium]
MVTGASCSDCGAPLGDDTSSRRCTDCVAADDLLSGARPAAAAQQRTRPFDEGRILRTGALPATSTNPVATMPRLMTADVEAAISGLPAGQRDDEVFTLTESSAAGDTREAWSIGDEETGDKGGELPIQSTRKALPRGLFLTACLIALVAVAALISLAEKPSLPDGAAGSGVAAEATVGGRDASGSGGSEATKSAPEKRPYEQPKAPAGRATKPDDDAKPDAPAPHAAAAPASLPPSADAGPAAEAPQAVLPPPDFAALMREGHAALKQGNLPDALTAFKAAAALRPRSAEAVTGIARAQAGSDKTAEAIKSFEKAVVLDPDYAPAWSGLAHLRGTSGNRDGAIDAYRRVIAIRPDSREANMAREALTDLGATEP